MFFQVSCHALTFDLPIFARLSWIKNELDVPVLIVFRSFGSELKTMLDMIEKHGFGDAIVRNKDAQPTVPRLKCGL